MVNISLKSSHTLEVAFLFLPKALLTVVGIGP
jgi:hypothetical protein